MFDILVIGGGIHGAAVARDAAGRGLKVMLAEKGDYACATSSASSKLIHGGLRYLEHLELETRARVSHRARRAVEDRAPSRRASPIPSAHLSLAKAEPLVHPCRACASTICSPSAISLPASGRLSDKEVAKLPRLRQDDLTAVMHYPDCQTDDARLTLSVALDARARGADILNRRAVTAITARRERLRRQLDERGVTRQIEARFIVNAAGPFVPEIEAMTEAAPAASGAAARARQPYRAAHAGAGRP